MPSYLDIIRQANELTQTTTQPDLIKSVNDNQIEIDWQLLASYLDSTIFQFIMQNRHIPEVSSFGLQLAQDLANKFNINRE
tara:strand:- start:648 stop:890 length:243 start_codon:yes stop_codon:yes gene_type:complete